MRSSATCDSILLVEDNSDDEALALLALKRTGFGVDVTVARDGQQALDQLFGSERLPILVLLDLKLPRIEGLEVLRRLRADPHTRRVPVVVLTTSCEPSDIARATDLGANSYVRKRVDFAEFQKSVAEIASYWTVLNERVTGASALTGP